MNLNNSEYYRYYDISFSYQLPFRKFSDSYRFKEDFDRLSAEKNISVKDAIDIYVNLAVADLSNNVTKMIKHDVVCNKKNLNCIIDYTKNSEIRNKILKKDFIRK